MQIIPIALTADGSRCWVAEVRDVSGVLLHETRQLPSEEEARAEALAWIDCRNDISED